MLRTDFVSKHVKTYMFCCKLNPHDYQKPFNFNQYFSSNQYFFLQRKTNFFSISDLLYLFLKREISAGIEVWISPREVREIFLKNQYFFRKDSVSQRD